MKIWVVVKSMERKGERHSFKTKMCYAMHVKNLKWNAGLAAKGFLYFGCSHSIIVKTKSYNVQENSN
jgi:hypothetical protein